MAKTPEHYDLTTNSAVADLSGRRLGRVAAVLKKEDEKAFRIFWQDTREYETLFRNEFLTRYTTESRDYHRGS